MNKKPKNKVKSKAITIRLTEEEGQKVDKLRDVYSVNISSFLRNSILKYYDDMIGAK